MSQFFSMAIFALTMSISPGPVNIITLSTSINHGLRRTLPFVIGASLGFTILLLSLGLSYQFVADRLGDTINILAILGAGLIVYFGYKLASSDGEFDTQTNSIPSFSQGAFLQVLNPKAWGACLAAISIFRLEDSRSQLLFFVILYFCLCLIGVGCWAIFGQPIRKYLNSRKKRKAFNFLLGMLLILIAVALLYQNFAAP